MSEVKVDEMKSSSNNSLLKNKTKEISDDQGGKNKRVVFQEKPIILNKISQKGSDSAPKADSGESDKNKEKKERSRPPTKVVVRRLPPSMTLETFTDNVSPLPEHDYIYFVRADMSLGTNAFSRAYINFVNMDDLLTFYEQFDNYVFMDNKGNEYPAVVEFAPFQRVPKKRPGRKKDPKVDTLKDDPAFIAFVNSLNEKKDTNSVKQASAEHLLTLTTESPKKDMTTPLLEFIKQRKAERQRMREEKREERKRKELERKRIKEEERKRRKDGDSVMKVLRNPDHEEKDDPGRHIKERDQRDQRDQRDLRDQRDRNQQIMKKREEERRQREKDRKDRRDIKGRDGPIKTFRDDRQKPMDTRVPRKVLDDPRRKLGGDRSMHSKHNDYEKSDNVKENEVRKMQGPQKDIEQRRGVHDKFQSHKENDRYSRDGDSRRGYRDDMRKNDKTHGYSRETDYRRGSYNSDTRRISHSYSESDTRRKSFEHRSNARSGDHKGDIKAGERNFSDQTEGKKWELLGAKPKKKVSDDGNVGEDEKESKSSDDVSGTPERESSADLDDKEGNKADKSKKEDKMEAPGMLLKRRSSLESDPQNDREFCDSFGPQKPKRQTSLDSEAFTKDACIESKEKNSPLSKSQDFGKVGKVNRRNSLDSKDFIESSEGNTMVKAQSFSEAETRELDAEKLTEEKDNEKSEGRKADGTKTDCSKLEDNKSSDGSVEGTKRDPRVERRIRNKDRPSIEIYRPGMGRFSMQRKEREKTTGIAGSSTEQDSPSNSPSPTPSTKLINSAKTAPKTTQELRSMTFKRSVSREK